ncbi:DUF3592 domain-containing protein [Kribbella sp. NPDC005582]|uniref:DUF3592 domain-containing protein n=1 Tax=Kribbella sp. NPDC005582 TaxID=3156893 RepID=UPI0033A0F261
MSRPRRWKVTWEGIACLIAALVFGAIGTVQIEDLYWLRHRGEVVTGTVVDRVDGRRPSIEVRYTTLAGETFTEYTSNGEGAVGESVEVIYDREEPTRMQTEDWGLGYGLPGVFCGVSVVFIVAGFVQLRPRR